MAPAITCICGSCQKCKHRDYMRKWYRENAEQHRATARASRDRRIEKVRAYDRERGYRVYDEEKVRVRAQVKQAILRGDLVRLPCEVCGEEKTDAHHEDYSRPLDVRFLCRAHHLALHRKVA